MTLSDALAYIHPYVGETVWEQALAVHCFDPVVCPRYVPGCTTLEQARQYLALARKKQSLAQHDWAYQGYAGQIVYWEAICAILGAVALVGAERLPDTSPPPPDPVTALAAREGIRTFAQSILAQAEKMRCAES